MFYNVVVNDWGETTYVPTSAGNILLAVVLVALLAAAAVCATRLKASGSAAVAAFPDSKAGVSSNTRRRTKCIVFCAMTIALGTVLSNIKLFSFPTGGSITLLSMLVICFAGYFYGLGAGLLTGVAYGVLQLLIDPYVLYPVQLIVDYILAFGALGLSGLFANAKNGLVKGYIAAVIGRYVFAVISGWIFFGAYAWEGWGAFTYSLAYNAIYIFAEAAVTLIIIAIPAVKKAIGRIKQLAVE